MSSFTEVFGGNVIYPAGQTYLSLTFSVDQILQWPIEQQVAGDVVSSIMDLNATTPGLNVDIPDATLVSNGIQSVFNNIGANTITIRDDAGGTILSIGVGEAWVAYLADNSTAAGTWRIFQLGASVSVANASALAGAGLKAIGSTLNQRIAPTSVAITPVTWTDANRAQLTIWTGGVGVLDLPTPGTVGSDWFSMVRNSGSGDLTVTPPSGLIDTAATLILSPGESAFIVTDGTNFFTVGLGQSTTSIFDFIEINVAGSGNFTLSGVQLNRISYRFIGVLTGNRTIIVPATVQQYWVDNSTTGAFTLDVASTAQVVTAPVIVQDARNILYCDGTDVVFAESNTVGFPISVVQGGTGSTTAPGALVNLGAAASVRILTAGDGIVGGGDLTADRTFDFDLASISIAIPDVVADFFVFQDVDNANVNAKALISTIAGLTIENEGVPLTTLANTLDFVGGFVIASGAGAQKTITIGAPLVLLDLEEIQFGTGNDVQVSFDGVVTLEVASAVAAGFSVHLNSSVAQVSDFILSNSIRGIGMRIIVSGDGQITNNLANGNFNAILIDLISSDDSVGLRFGGAITGRTRAITGAYPHNTDGGFTVTNNATGGGDSRALTFYDQHFACGDVNRARTLIGSTPVVDDDLVSDDGGAPTLRVGRYKFEMFMVVQGADTTTDFIFDFAGTNLATIAYSWESRSADGTPSSSGASGTIATDQTVDLGATVSEEVFLHIRGQFDISSDGGILQFRWAPSANVIDNVIRQAGAWMEIAAARIG